MQSIHRRRFERSSSLTAISRFLVPDQTGECPPCFLSGSTRVDISVSNWGGSLLDICVPSESRRDSSMTTGKTSPKTIARQALRLTGISPHFEATEMLTTGHPKSLILRRAVAVFCLRERVRIWHVVICRDNHLVSFCDRVREVQTSRRTASTKHSTATAWRVS